MPGWRVHSNRSFSLPLSPSSSLPSAPLSVCLSSWASSESTRLLVAAPLALLALGTISYAIVELLTRAFYAMHANMACGLPSSPSISPWAYCQIGLATLLWPSP